MAVQVAQIVAPLLLLFGTIFLGVLPIWLVRRVSAIQRGAQVLAFLVCLGGGVLFATTFLHLIPEVREGFEKLNKDFPVAEGVICLGFLAVYALEELIHAWLGDDHSVAGHGLAHSPALVESRHERENSNQGGLQEHQGNRETTQEPETETCPTTTDDEAPLHEATTAGILIVAALSFHSLFEGLSLGLQDSERATWIMFLAISFHKYVLAFVVGFDISASRVRPRNVVIQMLVFSVMSPLGALVGAITRNNLEDTIVVVVLNGIASGTLIYITFFEVLQRQKNDTLSGLCRLLAVIVGFTLMLTLILVLPHD
ncbi:zinc transporter ZIP3 [Ixodes scapularis]|uniref:Zinc/iron transporter, putative n=1 Tax=Ixodes scapularis TaxID=6945 RepID=B7QHR8_IXOSC|nr:zinc transporter ZIP3 [Ixodes scapularis]XP_029835776.3 zinc transporter ZIP3 [Ixodes scapularis]EEC18390.1 zinc/iron transporter, putative [Ixodes scapularis]|eukprot:XP_002414725.1 zinc/iron transporter, putative [Ixodes scapularis]